jgi:short chain dehydrogenase
MLLEDKNAVIYGAGGAIGGAVGRAFAREGARVFLAGRTLTRLEEVAEEIRSTGGIAEMAHVDALDEKAVDEHADAASAGGIDISFNLISHGDVHGTPMADMDLEDYARPVRDRREDDVPDLASARPPHDQAGIGRDLGVRRLGTSPARLRHRRHPGRLRGD